MSIKYYGDVPFDELVCPFGCGGKVVSGFGTTTLVGWSGGPEENPNHHTSDCHCTGCGGTFIKHWVIRGKGVWYTKDNYCIAGKPTCCEVGYKIHCKCGGWQNHSNCSNGKYYSEHNVGGHWIPGGPRYWQCTSCFVKYPDHHYGSKFMDEESIESFRKWAGANPKPQQKPLKLNWVVKEEIVLGHINPVAISKLKL